MFHSLNAFLLSLFGYDAKGGFDVKTLLRRYQILTIIYVNILIVFLGTLWSMMGMFGHQLPYKQIFTTLYPSIIASFVFLKKKKQDISAALVIVSVNLLPFSAEKPSLAGLGNIIVTPAIGFLVSSSRKVHMLNFSLCIVECLLLSFDISETFKFTFTEEQAKQIFQIQVNALIMIIFLWSICFVQKTVETNLWQLAHTNFERAEKINKEVIEAIEAKDRFVTSLSHEIRNPLNAMKGSIDYLFTVIKDPIHLQILDNARASTEILLNLLQNCLDAAKLKSDKLEVQNIETNSLDTIKKLVIMHSENLREKEISTTVYIHRNLPPTLWTDSFRLFQILVNLFSNAFKFTPKRGKISLCVRWCSHDESKENLLAPIDHTQINFNFPQKDKSSFEKEKSVEVSQSTKKDSEIRHPDLNISEEFPLLTNVTTHSKNIHQLLESEDRHHTTLMPQNVKTNEDFIIWHISGTTRTLNTQELFKVFSLAHRDSKQKNEKGYLKVQISDTGPGIKEDHLANLFDMFYQVDKASVYGGSGLGLWVCSQVCQKMGGDIKVYSKVNQGTTFVFYVAIDNSNLLNRSLSARVASPHDKVRALVVDDFAYNREIHKLLLEREAVQVTLASDGKEAVEKYIAQGNDYFDFVMMDIQMPVMDGFSAAKAIRDFEREKDWKESFIYFVSGEYYDENDIMRELRSKGQMAQASSVRCLRKPIDVEIIKIIIEKHRKQRKLSFSLPTNS